MSRFGKVRSALIRFGADRSALAALEFALIAPMMLLLTLGAFELNEAYSASRRVNTVAGSIADLVGRELSVTDAELESFFDVAPALMFPTRSDGFSMRISSLVIDADGDTTVLWSEAQGELEPLVEGEAYPLNPTMAVPETSVIVVDTHYAYQPPLGVVVGAAIEMTKTEFRRPRSVDPVARIS
jgi:Flp pilus assembly protein TadG